MYKHHLSLIWHLFFLAGSCICCQPVARTSDHVSIIKNDTLDRMDVLVGDQYFTSYLHSDTMLRKPVLFPLMTSEGKRVTRGYPIQPYAGERIDHPHHYGLWFNHGDVNGIDFWNSAVIPRKPNVRYGRIQHLRFLEVKSGNPGVLTVEKAWYSDSGTLFLLEKTRYLFSGSAQKRIITHVTTLTAPLVTITFTDSKEGMFALRVRRELELPSDKAGKRLTTDLIPSDRATVEKEDVTGRYLNREGLNEYPEVWGKRSAWMQLTGEVEDQPVAICLFDHPGNVNHPPHWMARDYGLFGVNPMGSRVYTEGKEQLDFTLKKGDFVTFTHQVVISTGAIPDSETIDQMYEAFASSDW